MVDQGQKSGSIDLAYKFYITEDENNFEENFQKLDIHLFMVQAYFKIDTLKLLSLSGAQWDYPP